jgi:phosphatidylserine decarboxylase
MDTTELHRGKSLREGLKLWVVFAAILLLIIPIGFAFGLELFVLLAAIGILMMLALAVFLGFFRDFTPVCNQSPNAIVSPAHGLVDAVEQFRIEDAEYWRVSIYLSLRDIHVQNAPISGTVRHLEFIPGQRRRAIHADAGQKNECLLAILEDHKKRTIRLKLIAGVFVRRIVPWVQSGMEIQQGQRFSLIRFGSRVDVFIPLEATVQVHPGVRVIGSETILALWKE